MPFFAKRLASRDMAAQMYAAKQSIETVHNAARLYLYDNKDSLPYGTTVLEGTELIEGAGQIPGLKSYGLPLGFQPTTSLGQDITFTISKRPAEHEDDDIMENMAPLIDAMIEVKPNDNFEIREYQVAELARMIGFFAKPEGESIKIAVPIDVMYTDVVLRKETDEHIGFLTELDMGEHNIDGVGQLDADKGVFGATSFNKLFVIEKNKSSVNPEIAINTLSANNFIFESMGEAAALSIVGSELNIGVSSGSGYADVGTIAKTGTSPQLNASEKIESKGFLQTDSSSKSFTVGTTDEYIGDWTIANNLESKNPKFILSGQKIEFGKSLYGTQNFDSISVAQKSGIKVSNLLKVPKIVFKNQPINKIEPGTNATIELHLSGLSHLPDVFIIGLNNEHFNIIINPFSKDTAIAKCSMFLEDKIIEYDPQSLTQAIACEYVYWNRLEHRINQKLCVIRGHFDGKAANCSLFN